MFSQLPTFNPLTTVKKGRDYVDTLSNKYIVKPKNAKGIGGFVFDYEGETRFNLQAEITDHFTEDNTSIQDHIAIKPLRMMLRGFIGELILKAPQGLLGALNLLQNRLTTVPAYLGNYTPQMIGKVQNVITQATSVVNTIDQSISRVKNIVGLFDKSAPAVTKQEKAYLTLQSLYFTKQIMLVETPYGVFNNMVIESLIFIQPEETKNWSDISVTLKQMNFARTETVKSNKKLNRRMKQAQPVIDKGKTQGTPATQSVLFGFFGH